MDATGLYKVTALKFIKGIISVVFGIFSAELVSAIVGNATTGKTHDVVKVSVILLVGILVYEGFILVFNIMMERANETKSQEFRVSSYEGFLGKPIYELNDLSTGSIIKNFTNDIEKIIQLYTNNLPDLLSNSVMALAYLIFIGIKDFKTGVILLIIGMVQIIPPIVVKRFMEQNYDETIKIEGEISDYIIEGFNGRSTIKLLDLKDHYLEGIKKFHHRYLKIGSRSELTAQGENAMMNAVAAILKFGTYGLIGWFVVNSYLTLDVATKVIVLSGGLYGAMNIIFTSIPNIGVAKKAMERASVLYSEIDEPLCNEACGEVKLRNASYEGFKEKAISDSNKIEAHDEKDIRLGSESGEKIIEVKNLAFSYENKNVLNNVNFVVNKGERVVIQGENGSGKSTLFDTLLGLHKDYKGQILIHGESLRNMDFDEYFSKIACTAQDDYGFSISPRGFLEILDEGCNLNLKEAFNLADEFGIKENVLDNEKIKDMSGGEKKKLYLIASLLKKSGIIFLDEPGNCLDIKGKEILRERLLESKKTIILITHDPFFEDIATMKIKVHDGIVDVNYLVDRGVI